MATTATLRGAAPFSTGSAAAASLSVTKTAGTAAGDLIILWPAVPVSSSTFTAAGFTAVTANSGTNGSCQLLYRRADGTEGATFTLTPNASRVFSGAIVTVAGPIATSFLFDPAPTDSGQVNAAGTTLQVSGITTQQNAELLLWFGFAVNPVGGGVPAAITLPSGAGLSWGAAFAQTNTTAAALANVGVLMASAVQSSLGSTGNQNGTLAASQANGGLLLAVPLGTQSMAMADGGAGGDILRQTMSVALPDSGSGSDSLVGGQTSTAVAVGDSGSSAEFINILKSTAPYTPPVRTVLPASPAFIRSQMPRMHLQNLLTGKWLHRDVQGVSSPTVTWQLNSPDSFTCTLAPPRPDLLDASGQPLMAEWQTACYLEESNEIKFGGILVSSDFNGPAWTPTFMGFMGYANGLPYEGETVKGTQLDAYDVVNTIWSWIQKQTNGNVGLVLDQDQSGFLLGNFRPPGAHSTLTSGGNLVSNGQNLIGIADTSGMAAGANLVIGTNTPTQEIVVIKSIKSKTQIVSKGAMGKPHKAGDPVDIQNPYTPYALHWWDDKDCGQEIASIQQEAVFDMWEQHTWTDSNHDGVKHRLHFGHPRIGVRQSSLRFAEGENIIQSAQGKRDGTTYANHVIGHGAGTGSTQIRSTVSVPDGRLRRVQLYLNQTVSTHERMTAKARRQLAAVQNMDAVTSITIKDHPNAPFGSFRPGDDILVRMNNGWRSSQIWSRITAITQDPTTDIMTLTLARSDSFSYMNASGEAGSL